MIPSKRLLFFSIRDTQNLSHWSGLNFFIFKALSNAFGKIETLSGLKAKHSFWVKIRFRISRMLGYNFYYDLTTSHCRQYGNQINERLQGIAPTEILFTINSQLIPYINLPNKIVLYNDATFANLYGYYCYFSNLTPWDRKQAFKNERLAMQRANVLFFASDWAAQSAIKDFGADPNKVYVLPFGANLNCLPDFKEIESSIYKRLLKPLGLLWVGVDYECKGGNLALRVANM